MSYRFCGGPRCLQKVWGRTLFSWGLPSHPPAAAAVPTRDSLLAGDARASILLSPLAAPQGGASASSHVHHLGTKAPRRWAGSKPGPAAAAAAAAAAVGHERHTSGPSPIAAAAMHAATAAAAASAAAAPGGLGCVFHQCRSFGVQRVVQKRRHQMRIVQPKQEPYTPPPTSGDSERAPQPLPLSLVNSGPVRRLLYSGTSAAAAAAAAVNWGAYVSPCRGVRWHPCGAWRVQFDRRNREKNFYVRADLYFRVGLYGFHGAKARAERYRKRLEQEWEELQETWRRLDDKRRNKQQQKQQKQQQQQQQQQQQSDELLL